MSDRAKQENTQSLDKKARRHRFFYVLGIVWMFLSYLGIEIYASRYLDPTYNSIFGFAFLWSLLLTCVSLALPRWIGKVVYGLSFFAFCIFSIGQCGYYAIFGRMLWVTDVAYASEGGTYIGSIGSLFSDSWWFYTISLVIIGTIGCFLVPHGGRPRRLRGACIMLAASAAAGIAMYPYLALKDSADEWGFDAEYKRALSKEGVCETMYDAKKVYNICGIYQTTVKDVWKHVIYPKTPMYISAMDEKADEINKWFAERGEHTDNAMTGTLEGKNVVFVLMESMDDFLINETDTPTLYRMMTEGINFDNFYTTDYGSVKTFNSEFCMNTGMFLPTNGEYAFAYCTNDFSESLPSLLKARGYSAEAFHYNYSTFYNRGLMEPAMGYDAYNSYVDLGVSGDDLLDDTVIFRDDELMSKFYGGEDGSSENFLSFIITRAAHMTYTYDEELSVYALEKYPQYRGMTGDEELDCIRAKAHLCDDMFAALLQNLEESGKLDNTVVVCMTDHYAYGMKNQQTVMDQSGVDQHLLVEKTPFFIWGSGVNAQTVSKTLNTSDVVPTLLNMLGIDSEYNYLGQDAFDDNYSGYAVFQDGSCITGDGVYQDGLIIKRFNNRAWTAEDIDAMAEFAGKYISINNLLLESNYYADGAAG